MTDPALVWRNRAQAAAASGDTEAATALYREAIRAHPDNPALLNSAGNFFAKTSQHADALAQFDRALALHPGFSEARINRAIMLDAMGRTAEAFGALDNPAPDMAASARYWSVRGAMARSLGRLDAAASAYDALLRLEPSHPRGLHGRARVALERGESDMCLLFERALPHNRADPSAFLGYAQALDYAGRAGEARQTAEMLVARLPQWTEALEFLAQLRWAAGERNSFCDHYANAATAAPSNEAIYLSWSRMLSGVDRHADAADVARRGAAAWPDSAALALAAAAHASEAGDLDTATSLFAALPHAGPDRWLQEARHCLRRRMPERADQLLAAVIADAPDTIGAWALRDMAWRMLDDRRAEWLHGQPGLVAQRPLALDEHTRRAVVAVLHGLHDASAMPVGQSVRDGSQTRGGLFVRMEPELRQVQAAIMDMVADHRAGLPAHDPAHPLLRHRDAPWAMRGSWSIRARGAGHHTEHIHPQGLLSSALHLVLPPDVGHDGAGCLELGRSPPDLAIGLEPIATVTPVPWSCVLFPSTMYHGTRPFASGERLTIAFDIALAPN